TAAIAEMLLQSHHDVIRLLPALPSAWTEGTVRGLRARARRTVTMAWANGQLTWAQLVSESPTRLTLRFPDDRQYRVIVIGGPRDGLVIETAREDGNHTWAPTPGDVYEIRPVE